MVAQLESRKSRELDVLPLLRQAAVIGRGEREYDELRCRCDGAHSSAHCAPCFIQAPTVPRVATYRSHASRCKGSVGRS